MNRIMSRRSSAFTLIELLVVVAIITILVAILMPSLAGARHQSVSVKCLANLRQLASGFHMYTNLHDGKLPEMMFYDSRGQICYFQQMADVNVAPNGSMKDPGGNRYWVRGFSTGIWSCPAVTERQKNDRAGGAGWTGGWGGGYGPMENSVLLSAGATRTGFPTRGSPRITVINRQASIWLIGDVWGYSDGNGDYFTWIATFLRYPNSYNRAGTNMNGDHQPAARHPKSGVNVAFVDGHAETRTWDSINANVDDIQAYRSY